MKTARYNVETGLIRLFRDDDVDVAAMREYEEESLTSDPPCCQNIPIFSRKIVGVGRFCHLWDKTNDKRNCFPKKRKAFDRSIDQPHYIKRERKQT